MKRLPWALLSLVCAVSLAVVTGIFRPSEQVNALWIVIAAACFYVLAYRFYAAFIAARVLVIDESRITPAHRLNDGKDYHPTHSLILFGHHFAAIAGAGPLIGPMLAAQFGYLPGFLWILIGSVTAGAVQDMVILFASVRRNGKSLAQIAKDTVGPVGGISASFAILFIIIVALAGLGLAVVNALANSPWGTFTLTATIPIALFMGLYMHRWRHGKILEASAIGVALLLAAVFFGHSVPGSFLDPVFNQPRNTLIYSIAVYGFFASVLPVWLLLSPRDYLSTYMKVGTIALLALGVIFTAPYIKMPAVTQFAHGGGPIIPGKLFPFMFITIACGAISGFHALISSGTTPKMIMSERAIRPIGYGAMITEGFVSIMALIAATVLVPGDYFAINSTLSLDTLATMGFPTERIAEYCQMVGVNVTGRPGGAVSLAIGMASIFSSIPGLKGLMAYWYNFALMFEALFILTTVDAGTRVARFLVQELFGKAVPALSPERKSMPGVFITSALVVAGWAYLIFSGSIATIWPMFGVSNQLLAGIALGVGTTLILKSGRPEYAWITAVPMAFMFVTTLTAAITLIARFYSTGAWVNLTLIALMSLLAVIALADMLWCWAGLLRGDRAKEA
ncbi:MAG: carbon starvation protein A [Fibrobacterota bacterium]